MSLIRPAVTALEDSPIVEIWRHGIGVPDLIQLWAGEPDLATPAFICDAATRALAEGHTFYTHNRGIPELRAALMDYHHRLYGVELPEHRFAVTSSGMNAVMLVAQAMVEPGDNVVAITPSWPNIMRAMEIAGAAVREVPLSAGNEGWRLDLADVFAACDDRTRVIYLASPGNPTGWTISRDEAQALLEFARARNLAILSDEVYHRIVYEGGAGFSFLEIAEPEDPVFVVNSFSKSWAMTGWRLGWMVYPEGLTPEVEKLIQFNTSGAPTFLQYGAVAALREGEEFVAFFLDRCRTGRGIVNDRLAHIPRLRNIPNSASYYAMFEVEGVTDTMQFCKRAASEARLGLAPGISFGRGAERAIRLCYAKGADLLEEATDRLGKFVARYHEH